MVFGELFAGIRGFGLGLEAMGCRTAWAADIEPFCQDLIRLRAPEVEVLGDVRLIDAGAPAVDGLVGGFPCQPSSAAGKGLAQADPRWLWPEFIRVIVALQPKVVVIENVPMLRRRGMVDVLRDLQAAGYSACWDGIPAAAVGAPHLRDRVWIVAFSPAMWRASVFGEPVRMMPDCNVADEWKIPRAGQMLEDGSVWETEPIAPVKTTRRDGWSYWNGVGLWPTPIGADARGSRRETARQDGWSSKEGRTLTDAVHLGGPMALHPTPIARDWKGQGMASQLGTNAALGLWPTPCVPTKGGNGARGRASIERGGGRGLSNAVGEAGEKGPLNPSWVEWLMGFPPGYTDLTVANEALEWRPWGETSLMLPTPKAARYGTSQNGINGVNGANRRPSAGTPSLDTMASKDLWPEEMRSHWAEEPLPRVLRDVPNRKARLQACGNALLPQIAALVAGRAGVTG